MAQFDIEIKNKLETDLLTALSGYTVIQVMPIEPREKTIFVGSFSDSCETQMSNTAITLLKGSISYLIVITLPKVKDTSNTGTIYQNSVDVKEKLKIVAAKLKRAGRMTATGNTSYFEILGVRLDADLQLNADIYSVGAIMGVDYEQQI